MGENSHNRPKKHGKEPILGEKKRGNALKNGGFEGGKVRTHLDVDEGDGERLEAIVIAQERSNPRSKQREAPAHYKSRGAPISPRIQREGGRGR